MREGPSVSVVTPFYNTDAYLAECIESVLSQTYTNFEYILVDNKSSDRSLEIAKHYAARDARVRIVQNDSFVSQLENYNGALRRIRATRATNGLKSAFQAASVTAASWAVSRF